MGHSPLRPDHGHSGLCTGRGNENTRKSSPTFKSPKPFEMQRRGLKGFWEEVAQLTNKLTRQLCMSIHKWKKDFLFCPTRTLSLDSVFTAQYKQNSKNLEVRNFTLHLAPDLLKSQTLGVHSYILHVLLVYILRVISEE